MRTKGWMAGGCVLALWTAPCVGQVLEEQREGLRQYLRDSQFASSFATLAASANELELSGARYRIEDGSQTRLNVFSLPFSRVFHTLGGDSPGIHTEAAVGSVTSTQHSDDVWAGDLPGEETAVDADSTVYSGLVGVGLELRLAEEVALTPIFDAGLAHIESSASYSGPGAERTAALFDGLLFNWDAWTGSVGGAARLEWRHPFGQKYEFSMLARYDIRWTETLRSDDPAQDFSSRSQLLTLRADLTGPTGLRLWGGDVDWRGFVGYRRFLEGELAEVAHYGLIGGALELKNALPFTVSLEGAFLTGDDMVGFSVGLGVRF